MHSNCDAYQTQWDEDCDDKGCCSYGKCVRFHAIGHDLQTPGYINVRENSLTCSDSALITDVQLSLRNY